MELADGTQLTEHSVIRIKISPASVKDCIVQFRMAAENVFSRSLMVLFTFQSSLQMHCSRLSWLCAPRNSSMR